MFTTASHPRIQAIRGNSYLQLLVVLYGLVWIWSAWKPLYPSSWLLENWLVFAWVGALALTHRRFPFSDLSYTLFAVFLALHAIGAHYTYANVPFGFWLQKTLHLARNPFDRIVHCSFGLLLAYPAAEVFHRIAGTRGGWSLYFPVELVLAASAIYEIIEALTAKISAPELGDAFLGTQGDIWDAQMDMAMAGGGAVVAMGITFLFRWRRRRQMTQSGGGS